MERKEKKPVKMSVPQFGGWEHKPAGVPTDYSMVFSQARANKKTQKNDLTEVKRLSVGNERDALSPNNRRAHSNGHARAHANGHARAHGNGHSRSNGHRHGHGHGHGHDHDEDPAVMRKVKTLSRYVTCFAP